MPIERSQLIQLIRQIVFDFRYVSYTFATIFLLSAVLLILMIPFPSFVNSLRDSRATPWGAVTSIFVHKDFATHYAPNMIFLFMFSLIFVLCNFSLPHEVRLRRARLFAVLVFTAAIAVNVFWLYLTPGTSFGASGAVFASEGVMMGFTLRNVTPKGSNLSEIRQFYANRPTMLMVLYNLIVFLAFGVVLIFYPTLFLAVGPGVNIIAHGIGFLIAFFGAYFFEPALSMIRFVRARFR